MLNRRLGHYPLEVVYGDKVLPIKVGDTKLVPKIRPYIETSKTIDNRLNELEMRDRDDKIKLHHVQRKKPSERLAKSTNE